MFKVVDTESLFSIIDADIDETLLVDMEDSKMEFSGANSIILYTALSRENFELLRAGNYRKSIKAYEYPEYAMGTEQASVLLKIAYDTQGLCDTLHSVSFFLPKNG